MDASKTSHEIIRTDDHIYYVDGVKTPSVTQILTAHLDIEFYHKTDHYKDRGSEVDRCCVLEMNGCLDWDSMDRRVRPYVEQFKRFLATTGFKPLLHHAYIYNEQFGYAGELDLFGFFEASPGQKALIDMKTGSPMAYYALQTAMYGMGVVETYSDLAGLTFADVDRYGLYLGPKKYKLVKHDRAIDFAYAQSICLAHLAKGIYQ